mgnify:CR=1 FL=1
MLSRAEGVRVPGGFAITAAAYRLVLAHACLDRQLCDLLRGLDVIDALIEGSLPLAELSEKLDKNQINQLLQASLSYRAGNITSAQYYTLLKQIARVKGISIDRATQRLERAVLLLVVERIFRDTRAFRIYDGPSEVHRWALGSRIVAGKLPS